MPYGDILYVTVYRFCIAALTLIYERSQTLHSFLMSAGRIMYRMDGALRPDCQPDAIVVKKEKVFDIRKGARHLFPEEDTPTESGRRVALCQLPPPPLQTCFTVGTRAACQVDW